jgi:small basic protein
MDQEECIPSTVYFSDFTALFSVNVKAYLRKSFRTVAQHSLLFGLVLVTVTLGFVTTSLSLDQQYASILYSRRHTASTVFLVYWVVVVV